MSTFTGEYTDLERALEDVRTTLADWADAGASGDPSAETIRHARVVLQEWLANLLEHGHFADRTPTVEVQLRSTNQDLHCVVVDNSEGFDLETVLPPSDEPIDGLPERGMGLRIMDACTDSLSYTAREDGRHRLAFSIPADHDPWLSTPF